MNIQSILSTTAVVMASSLWLTLPAVARPATLTATDPTAQINIRTEPTLLAEAPHYGLVGDRVEVLDSAIGQDGYTWYYIQFQESGAEGWVRGDLISLGSTSDQGSSDEVARRAQLEQAFEARFMGQNISQVMLELRQEGYNPTDDGRGRIAFQADSDVYNVYIYYNYMYVNGSFVYYVTDVSVV